jgi:DUF4097 and DUF4098 domain-containing protein YvlB
MPHWEFPYAEPVEVFVRLPAGSVTISAAATEVIVVDVQPARSSRRADEYAADVNVSFADGRVDISEPHRTGWVRIDNDLDIVVTVPAGSRCDLDTAAAEISCVGTFASIKAKSASGAIGVETVTGPAELTNISGAVRLDQADTATVKTSSGRIEIGQVRGDLQVASVSGKVRIGTAQASVTAQTSSGRITIDSVATGKAQLESISGDVKVNVVPGTGVYLDLSSISGKVTSELDDDADPVRAGEPQVDLRLSGRTVSGSIRVGRVTLADLASQ